jgi:hypothetical protein
MWLIVLLIVVVLVLIKPVKRIIFPFFLKWLAEENILVTTVKEGTVKTIMRGDSVDHFIMSFRGYHLNDPRKKDPKKGWYKTKFTEAGKEVKLPDWEIVYHGEGNKKEFTHHDDEYYDDRSSYLKDLGLYRVGWPWKNSVYVYGFKWNETYMDKKEGREKVLIRAEATDFIYVADFTYAIMTYGAETRDRLPTDELTLVTVAIRNPYRALFSGEDWMRRVTAAINRHVKNFVGSKGYDELISITKGKKSRELGDASEEEVLACEEISETSVAWSKEFSEPIIKLSAHLADENETSQPPTGLKGRYGVEIRTADLQTVDFSGTPEEKAEHQRAAVAVYTAEQTAKATLATGKADAKVIKMKGKREAEALAARLKVIGDPGGAGLLLAQLDAMQEASKGAGNTVFWANNPFIPLTDLLKNTVKKEGGERP